MDAQASAPVAGSLPHSISLGQLIFFGLVFIGPAAAVFAYAGKGIGPRAGYISGWLILLDHLLMQTLARVNRTFRGMEDGLLIAYAPLAEYSDSDQAKKPAGKNIDEAVALVRELVAPRYAEERSSPVE